MKCSLDHISVEIILQNPLTLKKLKAMLLLLMKKMDLDLWHTMGEFRIRKKMCRVQSFYYSSQLLMTLILKDAFGYIIFLKIMLFQTEIQMTYRTAKRPTLTIPCLSQEISSSDIFEMRPNVAEAS